MVDADEVQEHFSGYDNSNHDRNGDVVSRFAASSIINETAGIPSKRPTRESVLKRLSEALMRHTLTKVRK